MSKLSLFQSLIPLIHFICYSFLSPVQLTRVTWARYFRIINFSQNCKHRLLLFSIHARITKNEVFTAFRCHSEDIFIFILMKPNTILYHVCTGH